MKAGLTLSVGQNLTMTPQLQQAIRLLQMNALDLQQTIEQTLEQNPLLERVEDTQEIETDSDSPSTEDNISSENLSDGIITDEPSYETEYDDFWDAPMGSSLTSSHANEEFDIWSTQAVLKPETLEDHLLWQLQSCAMSEQDALTAQYIVNNINELGLLAESPQAILSYVQTLFPEAEIEEIYTILHHIHTLDPIGVGAQSIGESLAIQLKHITPESSLDSAHIELAIELVTSHLELLANHDYASLKRLLKTNDHMLASALDYIQTLNPNPASDFEQNTTQYIVPDVFIKKHKGRWRVELNPSLCPQLQVNALYAGAIKRNDKSEQNTFLKDNLQEAKWFIKSLNSRYETILNVASQIIKRQRLFFEYGEEAMRPLTLKDIADDIGMHESTISRVTTQKYMHTPHGILEFKYFFSSHVSTSDGGECSATAIRAMIKRLIKQETPKKPLSDNALATLLSEQGINVARRTVAKYRESLNIPASNERKKLK